MKNVSEIMFRWCLTYDAVYIREKLGSILTRDYFSSHSTGKNSPKFIIRHQMLYKGSYDDTHMTKIAAMPIYSIITRSWQDQKNKCLYHISAWKQSWSCEQHIVRIPVFGVSDQV